VALVVLLNSLDQLHQLGLVAQTQNVLLHECHDKSMRVSSRQHAGCAHLNSGLGRVLSSGGTYLAVRVDDLQALGQLVVQSGQQAKQAADNRDDVGVGAYFENIGGGLTQYEILVVVQDRNHRGQASVRLRPHMARHLRGGRGGIKDGGHDVEPQRKLLIDSLGMREQLEQLANLRASEESRCDEDIGGEGRLNVWVRPTNLLEAVEALLASLREELAELQVHDIARPSLFALLRCLLNGLCVRERERENDARVERIGPSVLSCSKGIALARSATYSTGLNSALIAPSPLIIIVIALVSRLAGLSSSGLLGSSLRVARTSWVGR